MSAPRPGGEGAWNRLDPEDIEFAVGDGEVSVFVRGRYFTHLPIDTYRAIQEESGDPGGWIIKAVLEFTDDSGEGK